MSDRDLFRAALDIPDPATRARFLDEHCRDPELRARVERMLAAHADTGNFPERPTPARPSPATARPRRPA